MTQDVSIAVDGSRPNHAAGMPEQFWSYIERAVDADGVSPNWGLIAAPDRQDIKPLQVPIEGEKMKVTLVALDLRYDQILWWAHEAIEMQAASEVIFGIDMVAKDGQGNEFGDFVAVFHYQRNAGWERGVIDYQFTPVKIVRPMNFEHAFWTPKLREMHYSWRKTGRPVNMTISCADGHNEVWPGLEDLMGTPA